MCVHLCRWVRQVEHFIEIYQCHCFLSVKKVEDIEIVRVFVFVTTFRLNGKSVRINLGSSLEKKLSFLFVASDFSSNAIIVVFALYNLFCFFRVVTSARP